MFQHKDLLHDKTFGLYTAAEYLDTPISYLQHEVSNGRFPTPHVTFKGFPFWTITQLDSVKQLWKQQKRSKKRALLKRDR